jgi:hypothetical protein
MENMREYPTKGSPGKENRADQCPQDVEPGLHEPLALLIKFKETAKSAGEYIREAPIEGTIILKE